MGFVDYLRTRGMNDGEKLYLIAEDGATFELKREYKKLSDAGTFEVIIFNSVSVLEAYCYMHPDKFESTKKDFFNVLFNKAKIVLKTSDTKSVLNFLNSRIKFYSAEIKYIYEGGGFIPGKLYTTFYISPLISEPESNNNLGEILMFHRGLTIMMKWVQENALKI